MLVFLKLKERQRNSKIPKSVTNAVFRTSSEAICIWNYSFYRSNLENTVEPAICEVKSVILGNGYLSGTVTLFNLL